MIVQDNYGQLIPRLYLIDHLGLDNMEDAAIKRGVANADWYIALINQGDDDQPTSYLMANAQQLNPIGALEPEPFGDYFVLPNGSVSEELGGVLVEVLKVNDVLKRWSIEDGFYSA